MAIISRRQYDHPALATAGGSALHASISNLYTVLGDDSMSRYKTFTAVANSSVGVIAHEFGLDFANLKVQIFTGTYPALTLVSDPIGTGWTVAATSGLASRSIDVTAPASGGPHTYAVLVSHESNATNFIPGLVSIGTQSFAGAKNFLSPILSSLGSVSLPGYSFTGDPNTGMWSSAADTLSFSTAGAKVAEASSAGAWTLGQVGGTLSAVPVTIGSSTTSQAGGRSMLALSTVDTSTSAARSYISWQKAGVAKASIGVEGDTNGIITGGTQNQLSIAGGQINFSGDVGTTLHGSMSTAGAWTFGPASFAGVHTVRANDIAFNAGSNASDLSMAFSATKNWVLRNVASDSSFLFRQATDNIQAGFISSTGAWTLGPAALFSATKHTLNGAIVGYGNSTQASFAGADTITLTANVYRSSAGLKGVQAATGYALLNILRSTTSGGNVLSFSANYQDAQTVDGVALTTNDRTILAATAAGAWTLGSTSGTVASVTTAGLGQTNTSSFSTTGNLGGTVLLSTNDGAAAGAGGAVLFKDSGNTGYAAIKGALTSGASNTTGQVIFFTRLAAADATLTNVGTIANTGAWTLGFAGHTGAQTAYGSHFDLISATSLASTYIKLTNSDFTKQSFIGQETSTVANSFVTGAPAYSLGIAANNGIYFSGSASTLHGFMTSAGAWTFPANIASTSTTTGTVIVTGGMGVSGKAYHGDNIVMSDGKGIDFAAFTDGSVDGTATSQVLNDYEEGTWTPVYSGSAGSIGATAGTFAGTYTKIGRKVYYRGEILLTNKGSWTSKILITGLPFTPQASKHPIVSTSLGEGLLTSLIFQNGYVNGSGGQIVFGYVTAAATSTSELFTTDVSNTFGIGFSGSYEV